MQQSAFHLVLRYAIGIVGVVMRRFNFPTAPVLVGMILDALAEAQRRSGATRCRSARATGAFFGSARCRWC